MNDIRSLLKMVARRLELSRFIGVGHVVFLVIAVAALILVPTERVGAALFIPWQWLIPALLLTGLAISGAIWWSRRLTEHAVAITVDEQLDLREKLSTALCCERDDDAFARAAVEDAVRVARDARTHERARRMFTVAAPGRWWLSPLVVFIAFMLSYISPLDLFGGDEKDPDDPTLIEARAEQEALGSVVQEIEQSPELKGELGDLLDELKQGPIEPSELTEAEDVRRDAIKSLSELNDRLEDILDGEQGKMSKAVEQNLKRLQTPEEGPAKEFAEALANGDFGEAENELQKMLEKIKNGELDQAQMDQLADQLQDLAEQLEQLAQEKDALEDALKKAGMDPDLADNPQALQQAIQNNDNLNEQQKQQLQQMAQAQQQAQQMCQNLAGACKGLGQAMQGQGQLGEAGQQMAGQLNDLEQIQQLMQQAQAAANMCQGQCQGLGQGMAMDQLLAQAGGVFGPRGQSSGGGKAPLAPTPFKTKIEKANIETTAGDIIARMKVDGPVTIGESKKAASAVVTEVLDAYEEAVIEEPLPRKYQDAQKHYFGEWERQVKTDAPASEPPATAPPAGEGTD